jgi:hypothetical protein
MNNTSNLDQAEQEALNLFTYEVSDEALEASAVTGYSTGGTFACTGPFCCGGATAPNRGCRAVDKQVAKSR